MSDHDEAERARISREARDAVAGRRPRTSALGALQRYLAAERYREKKPSRGQGKDRPGPK